MKKCTTKTHIGFDEAAKKNWYLTCMAQKPAAKVKIKFEDGNEYTYKSKNTINIGDVAVIGPGCKTSSEMGKVTLVGAGGGSGHLCRAQYVFADAPSQDEIKKMSAKIFNYQDPDTVFKKLVGSNLAGVIHISIVDTEIENVLFACCILAHEELAAASAVKKAKDCLANEKFLCPALFGTKMNEHINECAPPMIYFDISGYYTDWEENFLNHPILSEIENKKNILEMDGSLVLDKKPSKGLEKFFKDHKDFAIFYNELVFRSALSIVIRGGFVNILNAAMNVHMPIEGFYDKLIELAQEIGSSHCLGILEEHRSEYVK